MAVGGRHAKETPFTLGRTHIKKELLVPGKEALLRVTAPLPYTAATLQSASTAATSTTTSTTTSTAGEAPSEVTVLLSHTSFLSNAFQTAITRGSV